MATYKKRGGKPRTKIDKQQSIEDASTTAEVFNTLDEGASKTEQWVVSNQKYIFIVVALLLSNPSPSSVAITSNVYEDLVS